jgi:acyl-CoA hydrolase
MTEIVLPQHTNNLGGIFGGVVMSWIDIAAAIASARHSGRTCVTASVDELHFLQPIKLGDVVNIQATVTCVHTTSCEVMVRVMSEHIESKDKRHTTTAYLTFVALDSAGRPTPMPKLKTKTQDEKRLEKRAKIRHQARRELKARLEKED